MSITISTGCTSQREADTSLPAGATPRTRGIWPNLDRQIQLARPARLAADRVSGRIDDRQPRRVLSIDGAPRKVCPLGGTARLSVGDRAPALHPGDRAATGVLPSRVR